MTEIRWYEEGKPHMRIKENKGVTWLNYQAFEQFPDIVHACRGSGIFGRRYRDF